ncbi:MAG: hypothetical protein ACP5NS_00605 [Candidatus Pacearchaeota archaeon]
MGMRRKMSLGLGAIFLLSSFFLVFSSYAGISGYSVLEDVDYYVGSSVFILLFVLGVYFVAVGTRAE